MCPPQDPKTAGYTLHSHIPITSMFAEHLNMSPALAGSCKAFWAQNRSTEIPLSSPEHYCNCKVTDDSPNCVPCCCSSWRWQPECIMGKAVHLLFSCSTILPHSSDNQQCPRSSANENGVGEGEDICSSYAVHMQTCPRGIALTIYRAWWVYHWVGNVLNACMEDRLKFSYAEQWTNELDNGIKIN